MEMKGGNSVCVMDAAGCLGSALVRCLLLRGYTVHAAFQTHDDDLMQSLKRQYAAEISSSRLKVFQSDLLDYHSILEAIKGCCGLFYSFEPPSDYAAYDEFMGEIEVRAAHNVVEACAQTSTIDKVVFTSSATAVVWGRERNAAAAAAAAAHALHPLDERSWSDVNFCKNFKLWHGLSKTVAEKAAWALAMDREVNMVSINGGLLISPGLSMKDPYLKGAAEMYEGGFFVAVDLGFLVDAHICVFEDVSSYGRYLCFNRVINCSEDTSKLANMLLSVNPSHPLSTHSTQSMEMEDDRVHQQKISNQKLSKLMLGFESGALQIHI
nr:cinnamoyl-CoA reductase-like SNL6 [Ipomoea trifida]